MNNSVKTVGYWFSEKKSMKFGTKELNNCCLKRKIIFKKIELNDLDDPGKLNDCDAILHKFTALYAPAITSDDSQAKEAIEKIEQFLLRNSQIIVIDPIECAKMLLMRMETYKLLHQITDNVDEIFTPSFVEIDDTILTEKPTILEERGITFPVVCKALHAGGSVEAHQMALIFDKEQLKRYCTTPCVVQCFINHNAVLYKIFVIGNKWFLTTRPSLKNFQREDHETICFNSHHISKAGCNSPLTTKDAQCKPPKANLITFQLIVKSIREALKSDLLGIDVIIDVVTDTYGIIDVNPFPSYDGVPSVMEHLAELIRHRLDFEPSFSSIPIFCHSEDLQQKYVQQDLKSFVASQARIEVNSAPLQHHSVDSALTCKSDKRADE